MADKQPDAPPPYPGLDQNYPAGGYPPPGTGPQYSSPYPPPAGQPYVQQPYPGQPYPAAGPQPPKGPPVGQDQTTVIVAQQPQQTVVVRVGECPQCRQGIITENFTCCGILLGICFFPLGLICCFVMRERRCSNCGASF